jgi:hypothetical protein
MAEDKRYSIGIETKARGDGAKKTQADLKNLTKTVDQAQTSVDELEKELKQAEAALSKADVGTREFRKLQKQIAKTKEDLKGLKVGNLDDRGLARLQQRFGTLKQRVQQVQPAIRRTKDELSKGPRTQWIDRTKGKLQELNNAIPVGGRLSGFFNAIASGASSATVKIAALAAGFLGFVGIVRQGIGTIGVTEDLEASFTTLLGSVDKAQQRIQEMREFAAKTPLSIAGLATASRVLETLSGNALGAEESLRLVGDAAAVAQRPGESLDQTIQNVALHVGRLNAALKSGKGEIGESTLRLQELGLISADTSFKLRELHKEGTRGEEAWGLLESTLKSFEGEMERRSKTINGLISTLRDAWGQFTAAVATPFAAPFKAGVRVMISSLNGLTAALIGTLRFLGLMPQQIEKIADKAAEETEKVKEIVADLQAAAKQGAEEAEASISRLAANYDRLERSIQKNVTRANELVDLRLKLQIQEIEGDKTLSPLEKERRKGAAREAAGQATSQNTIQGLQRTLELAEQQRVDFQQKISFQAEQESKLANQIASLEAELRGRPGSARQDFINRLETKIAGLEKREADLQKDGSLGPSFLELSVRNQRLRLESQLLDLKRGQELPVDDERKKQARSELKSAQEALANAKQEVTDLTSEFEATRAGHAREIRALQDEIEFQREKARLQGQLAQGETQSAVSSAQANQRKERAKAEENRFSTLQDQGGDVLGGIAATLERLAAIAVDPAQQGRIEGVSEGVGQGNLAGVGDITQQAVTSTNEDAQRLGAVLEEQTASLRRILAQILATQQSGVQGLLSVGARAAALESEMARALSTIDNLQGQVKNLRNQR